MTPQMPPQQQPAAPASPSPGTDDGSGGYCIEIEVAADGSITVEVETKAQEAAEGDGPDTDSGTPASSIDEALKIARQIYASKGQAPDGKMGVQEAFNQGFQGDDVNPKY